MGQFCFLCTTSKPINYCWYYREARVSLGSSHDPACFSRGHIESPLCHYCQIQPALIHCFDELVNLCCQCFNVHQVVCIPRRHSVEIINFTSHWDCRHLNSQPLLEVMTTRKRSGGPGRGHGREPDQQAKRGRVGPEQPRAAGPSGGYPQGKDGAFYKKLNAAGLVNVEDFLRKVVKDSAKLRTVSTHDIKIFGSGMSNKMWDVLVEHAKTCVLSGKLYIYYAEDSRTVGVVFNNICALSGLMSGDQYFSADSLSDSQKVYVDGLAKKAYDKLAITQTDPLRAPANYSTVFPFPMLPSQFPEFSIGGYNQTLATAQPHNPQAQFDTILQQDQFMGIHHTTIENQNVTGFAFSPPLQAAGGYQDIGSSVHQGNLNPLEDWSNQLENDFFSEEEIQLGSHELLENDDMQQLLQLFSMGGNGEDGFAFPPMMQGYEEDRGR